MKFNSEKTPPRKQYTPVFMDSSGQMYSQSFRPMNSQDAQDNPMLGVANKRGAELQVPQYTAMNQNAFNYGGGGKYGTAKKYNPNAVPSYDPVNPQEDAISQSPTLKKSAQVLNQNAPTGERLAFINPFEEAVLKNMGGSGKPSAGGVPSYKKGDVDAPPPRNYGQETRDTLQAQVDLAPDLYRNEAQFRPQYANLERGIMLEQLGLDPSMGLLQAYEDHIVPAQGRQKARATADEIQMIQDLGPKLVEAQRSADPLAEGIRQDIMGSAKEGLRAENPFDDMVSDKQQNLGGSEDFDRIVNQAREEYQAGQGLTETEQRDLDQQILEGASDRGMEDQRATFASAVEQRLSANRQLGKDRTSGLINALTNRDQYGRQRENDYARAISNQQAYRQQALQNAGTAYQMGNFDVLQALTGRSGNAPMMAQQQFGSAGFSLDSSPAIFNPESQYAGALATQNYQGQMDARTATASNRAGVLQGLMGMGGGIIGGMAKGGTGLFR